MALTRTLRPYTIEPKGMIYWVWLVDGDYGDGAISDVIGYLQADHGEVKTGRLTPSSKLLRELEGGYAKTPEDTKGKVLRCLRSRV